MKKLLLFVVTIVCINTCFAQDTVEIKNRLTDSVVEKFYVLKSDGKTRQGPYRAYFKRKITIAAGQYTKTRDRAFGIFTKPMADLLKDLIITPMNFCTKDHLKRILILGFFLTKT